MPRIAPPLLLGLLGLATSGCGFFGNSSSDGSSTPGDASFGYSVPTLEVTISGVHFGPSAPDSGSGASLVNTRDSFTGRITRSSFSVYASSAASGASCSLNVFRQGDGVFPIGVGASEVAAPIGNTTRDGTVAPSGVEGVAVPQGSWQCSGANCNGAVFSITRIEPSRIEGFFAGNLQSSFDGSYRQVVCSFYVPLLSYVP